MSTTIQPSHGAAFFCHQRHKSLALHRLFFPMGHCRPSYTQGGGEAGFTCQTHDGLPLDGPWQTPTTGQIKREKKKSVPLVQGLWRPVCCPRSTGLCCSLLAPIDRFGLSCGNIPGWVVTVITQAVLLFGCCTLHFVWRPSSVDPQWGSTHS